jgi:16S rRNA (adenine1518-N6/adenine1519-N6)-dimethyltransferase
VGTIRPPAAPAGIFVAGRKENAMEGEDGRLCDARYVRALLARHGFHFSRARGQNFLTADWVPQSMVRCAGLDGTQNVFEVGPGLGALTRPLARAARRVVTVEVDVSLRPVLAETLAGLGNVDVLWADVLTLDLPALVATYFAGRRPVVCANLPYAVTTPVLARLLGSGLFEALTVMVQKEVAQRLCAAPGTSAYGAFSVYVGVHARPAIAFDVPPDAFLPRPRVTSSVVHMVCQKRPLRHETLFFRLVRAAFGQRRKTLLNALAPALPFPKDALSELIASCGLAPSARGETLGIPEFEALSDAAAAQTGESGFGGANA